MVHSNAYHSPLLADHVKLLNKVTKYQLNIAPYLCNQTKQ